MNFNFSEIFTNIINYLIKYLSQANADMPWLKFLVLGVFILVIITKIKITIENKKQIRQNINYLQKHQKNSAEIKKKNYIENERRIINSSLTYVGFYFKFLKFKTDENKPETPNFTKLILSFLSDINLYKASFIKTDLTKEKPYYFLKFDFQEEAITFLQNFEKQIEDFSPILSDFGYEISYTIAIDNRNKNKDIKEITYCLENILKTVPDTGIYTTIFFKEFYDRNSDNNIYLSFTPQGKYMIGSESIELYHLEK